MRGTSLGWLAVALCVAATACDDETQANGTPTATTSAGVGGSGGLGGSAGSGAVGGLGGTGGTGGNVGGSGGELPNTPGTITITVSGRNGDDGKSLIASVLTPTGTDSLGGICETISGGSASGVVSEFLGLDICDLGNPVTFDPGTYPVYAGIYPSGSPTPELCTSTSATVGGDITVVLDNFSACQ